MHFFLQVTSDNITQFKREQKSNKLRKTKAKAVTVQFDANLSLTHASRTAEIS